jgi:hypothetical protein
MEAAKKQQHQHYDFSLSGISLRKLNPIWDIATGFLSRRLEYRQFPYPVFACRTRGFC